MKYKKQPTSEQIINSLLHHKDEWNIYGVILHNKSGYDNLSASAKLLYKKLDGIEFDYNYLKFKIDEYNIEQLKKLLIELHENGLINTISYVNCHYCNKHFKDGDEIHTFYGEDNKPSKFLCDHCFKLHLWEDDYEQM